MKQCKNCLETVNDDVFICPHCGHAFDEIVGGVDNSQENAYDASVDAAKDDENNANESAPIHQVNQSEGNNTKETDNNSQKSTDWIVMLSAFLKACYQSGKDFVALIIHPDAQVALSKRSLILFVIIELLSTFALMSTFGKSVYLYILKPYIVLFGLQHLWLHQFQMSAIIPFAASIALLCISALIYTLTLIIGRQKASFTQVVSHLLVPSLALLFAAVTLRWLLPLHVSFLYLAIGFVLLWLIATLMHVVDDLRINNFYLRIFVLSLVAVVLVSVIGLCFQYMMASLIQFPANNMHGMGVGHIV